LAKIERQPNSKSSANVAAREYGTCLAQPDANNGETSNWFHVVSRTRRQALLAFFPTTGAASRWNPSGSGTSSSGGKDDNGDAGRDKMPESNRTVRPESQQHHPND
jgi:hypothetical protein